MPSTKRVNRIGKTLKKEFINIYVKLKIYVVKKI